MKTDVEPVRLVAYGLSDSGLVRQNNEDVWGCLPQYALYLLADGMGGHQAGEVAAREAVIRVCSSMRKQFEEVKQITASSETMTEKVEVSNLISWVKSAISQANTCIYELAQTDECMYGMGTTLSLLLFQAGYVICAHVGDSRIYRLRGHDLEQLTEDHTLLREMIDSGKLQRNAIQDSSYKNILTRAVGTTCTVDPSMSVLPVNRGDLYLLCSDGLSDLLTQQEIRDIIDRFLSIEEKVRLLIAAAKHKGGYDNITVVLIEVQGVSSNENIS